MKKEILSLAILGVILTGCEKDLLQEESQNDSNHFNINIVFKSIFMLMTSFLFCSCNSDDSTINDERLIESFVNFTYEGGDNNNLPKEIKVDDEYYYYSDIISNDIVLIQTELEEHSRFENREEDAVKYRFKINLEYNKSENTITDYDIEFGEFLEIKNAIYATVYQNYKTDSENSIIIDNVVIQDGYIIGDIHGVLYDNILGLLVNDPTVKEMKITNGKFKIKLEE